MFRKLRLGKKARLDTGEKMNTVHGKLVIVTKVVSGEVYRDPSIKPAAENCNTSSTTIRRHLDNNSKLYYIYLITKKIP